MISNRVYNRSSDLSQVTPVCYFHQILHKAEYKAQKMSLRLHVNAPVTVKSKDNFAILHSLILSTLSITLIPSLLDYCYSACDTELIITPLIQKYQRKEQPKISCFKENGQLREIVLDTKQTLFAVHETYSWEYDTMFSEEMLTFRIMSLRDSMAFTCSVVVFISIC
jgi:predicted unusual protein kinase regulating ubiquinone biosynthesis (AarF/ABC1/UbiB family)